MKEEATFAFLVHPRGLSDVFRKFPYLRIFPRNLVHLILRCMPPVVVSRVTGLIDVEGQQVTGYVISIPITARQMMEDRRLALKKMKEAAATARKMGVKIVGLGGLTSSLSKGGLDLADAEPEISFTTGRAYTVKTVTDYVKDVLQRFSFNKEKVVVAIVGAAGSIGSGCAEVLAQFGVKNFILVDLERKVPVIQEKMLSYSGGAKLNIIADHKLSVIKDADIIITATNAPEVVVRAADLKSGAIIVNDAQPSDIADEIYDREDILVIEGGIVSTPGVKPNFNMGFAERDQNFCCLAEVLVLAHNKDTSSHFTLGNLDIAFIDQISKKSESLNFSITRYQNDRGYIPTVKVDRVRAIIASRS